MINTSALPLGITPDQPAFSLYQQVRSNYYHEDYQAIDDLGVIVGLVYSPARFLRWHKAGWLYYVCWFYCPSSPDVAVPFIEEILEEDLVETESEQRE